jgi:hypothetical protein
VEREKRRGPASINKWVRRTKRSKEIGREKLQNSHIYFFLV